MKNLYLGSDNCYDYIFVRDMEKDEDDTLVVEWDLSDEEIEEIVSKFKADENDTSFYLNSGQDWKPFDEVMEQMNCFRLLA